jgi:hypothetical protein
MDEFKEFMSRHKMKAIGKGLAYIFLSFGILYAVFKIFDTLTTIL